MTEMSVMGRLAADCKTIDVGQARGPTDGTTQSRQQVGKGCKGVPGGRSLAV